MPHTPASITPFGSRENDDKNFREASGDLRAAF